MADDYEQELVQTAARVLHAASTSADALGPEAYPQKQTDTAEKLTGHPGSRGDLLPIGIPEGGFQSEPFTWARVGERLHIPAILHHPVNTFHQLHDYISGGGDPTDPDAIKLATETAVGMMGIGGTTATNAIYMGGRMRDAAISGAKELMPESNGMLMHQDGSSIRQRLPGEISRPNPDSNMFDVSKYDLEADSQARFGQPYDKLTPDMQRWVKSNAIATMKPANDPEAVAPKLGVVEGGSENWGKFRNEILPDVNKGKSPDLIDPDSREAIFNLWNKNGFDLKAARNSYATEIAPRARVQNGQLKMPKGLTFEEHTNSQGQTSIHIYNEGATGEGEHIGRIYVRDLRGQDAIQIGNISLDENIQRKGIATAVQEYLEKKLKKPMVPDSFLSDAEYARWQKIDPQAVEHYRPIGESSWEGRPRTNTPKMIKRRRELRQET